MKTYQYFLDLNQKIVKPSYIQGVPNLDKTFSITFFPEPTNIVFKNSEGVEQFRILKENIIDIYVEDQSSIENRVSISRMLLVGVFAFAWKKREKMPLSFLIFKYKDDLGGEQQMIIQSDQPDSFQTFTNIKYNLQLFWKEALENPNIVEQINAISESHNKKVKEDQSKFQTGCIIVIIVLGIICLAIFS